jgi:hypothetical protein
MRKSFEGLWEAMEARRREVAAGEMPLACRMEEIRQAQRQRRGCPDGESLGGWAEGKLQRISMRRWMSVWRHVHLRRCRECQAEIAALAIGRPAVSLRLAELAPPPNGGRPAFRRAKTPLLWGSSVIAVMIGLSQWSTDIHDTLPVGSGQLEAPWRDDTHPEPAGNGEYSGDAQTEPNIAQTEPLIWDDSPHAQRGYPQAAQSHVDRQ